MAKRTIPSWAFDNKPAICPYCHINETEELHHIVPISLGGTTTPDNVIWLCKPCHRAEHSKKGHYSLWGKKGGSVKSPRKTEANRKNAALAARKRSHETSSCN